MVAARDVGLGLIFAGYELAAQKLADRRFGNFRDEDVAPRTFEVGEADICGRNAIPAMLLGAFRSQGMLNRTDN